MFWVVKVPRLDRFSSMTASLKVGRWGWVMGVEVSCVVSPDWVCRVMADCRGNVGLFLPGWLSDT